jgi:Ca2+/H+ antiporter, TMEM165/GDT1 family
LSLEALGLSAGAVALAEIGDKTQLLAVLLAARYRQAWPIIAGITVATLANHALAAAFGTWITRSIDPAWLRWGLGLSFIAVALWMLRPDSADDGQATALASRWGVFGVTVIAFFAAEMGDKTQVATVMLAAHYDAPVSVTVGTTAGMLMANVPAVLLGEKLLHRLPVKHVHRAAALLFIALGVLILLGAGG